jgi:CHAT domain-containing protein
MTQLLVVSSDGAWKEYLRLELGTGEIEIFDADSCRSVCSDLRNREKGTFSGVLIDIGSNLGRTQEQVELDVTDLLTDLRLGDTHDQTPVILWFRYPSEQLSRIAGRFKNTAQLSADKDKLAAISAALFAASGGSGKKPQFARIELDIGDGTLRSSVIIDGKGVIDDSHQSTIVRPKLQDLEKKFSKWALWQRNDGAVRYTDYWRATLTEAGTLLAQELAYDKLSDKVAECMQYVDELSNVHFRFSLLESDDDVSHPYAHVPFELLYDEKKAAFIRSLAPVARRICLKSATLTATPLAKAQSFTGRMLFIKSDAHGLCDIPNMLFNGQSRLSFQPLKSLSNELSVVEQARANCHLSPLCLVDLSSGTDGRTIVEEAFARYPGDAAPLQIVHFAGHSVQSDDGHVYLILPTSTPGRLSALSISHFAKLARGAGVQLVVLSSCESSSPEAVFRLAQFGVPAVIGFRWEVNDKEAPCFTERLHQLLASGKPLARAFHLAVSHVENHYPATPTFASPMLVMQNDEWTI